MKQPRIADFDPHAKERKLTSPMDDFPVIRKPPVLPTQEQQQQTQPQSTRTAVPPYGSTPQQRKMKQRHPFDIYQDQYDELKKISFEVVAKGGIGTMSSMVREAIDMYLAKRKKE